MSVVLSATSAQHALSLLTVLAFIFSILFLYGLSPQNGLHRVKIMSFLNLIYKDIFAWTWPLESNPAVFPPGPSEQSTNMAPVKNEDMQMRLEQSKRSQMFYMASI